VDAPAKKRSIGLEKNKVTGLRDGSNQVRNARMTQRLASSNPNNGAPAAVNFANSFVRNGMAGIVMQNLRRIHKLNDTGLGRA